MNVAVVGGGIMGLSAARSLTARGCRVTLFEQFEPFHGRGSSHGNSRIVRRAYPDAYLTGLMGEAYPRWAALEAEAGEQLLHEVGLVTFGAATSPEILATVDALEAMGVEHRVYGPREVGDVFFDLHLRKPEVGIWTPGAGWVHARKAAEATWRIAQSRGAHWIRRTIDDPTELLRDFDVVIVTPGAWIQRFVDVPVTVKRMTVAYLPIPVYGPVWIEDSRSFLYGFPADEDGVKVGVHASGVIADPDDPLAYPSERDLELIRQFAARRFDRHVEPVKPLTCLYTMAPNEDFLFGRVADGVFFASPCSGHGFKFAPWVGERLADFAQARSAPESFHRFCWPPMG